MIEAKLHDGAAIPVEVSGGGPAVLLPVNPIPVTGAKADELRAWGVDPALGRTLIDGLADAYTVVAFDYEGHVLAHPKPATLTPDAVAADVLAVADAAGVDRFAYYGYSWLALAGLQLALRTDRLTALAMGGYPPIGGPYAEMLQVTRATHEEALHPAPTPAAAADWNANPDDFDWSTVEMTMTPDQTRQFVTLYTALDGFDDTRVRLTCPRLCFAGSADVIAYGARWGDARVDIAGPLLTRGAELAAAGWQVRVLDGLDHTAAMQPGAVLPILRPFLDSL
ncbi:MAG: alpha/beta hydrolase [Hamadaea sp.]|nr:alpha/beta hydrolase [Hamadaea sp.]